MNRITQLVLILLRSDGWFGDESLEVIECCLNKEVNTFLATVPEASTNKWYLLEIVQENSKITVKTIMLGTHAEILQHKSYF